MMNEEITNVFGQPIHVYTRAQAIADGVLVDITKTAQEAGFTISVADTVLQELIEWNDEDSQQP